MRPEAYGKKNTMDESNNYLVISPTKKRSAYVFKQFRDYIWRHHIMAIVQSDKETIIVSSGGFHGRIRFVTEEKFYLDTSFGFRGWVLDCYQMETWLDAAREYEKEKK